MKSVELKLTYNLRFLCYKDILVHILYVLLGLMLTTKAFSQAIHNIDSQKTSSTFDSDHFVDQSNGTMTYSVNLFSIESQGVTIPISLNYLGGGIQVFSESSWVGAGWEISYPGLISRQENGIADDLNEVPSNLFAPGAVGYLNEDTISIDGFSTYSNSWQSWTLARGFRDLKPDYFNMTTSLGFNGSFSLKRKTSTKLPVNQAGISDYSFIDFRLSILDVQFSTLEDRLIKSFKVTAPSGLKYYFNDNETIAMDKWQFSLEYTSNWYLSKIYSELDEEIFDIDYFPGDYPINNFRIAQYRNLCSDNEGFGSGGEVQESVVYKKYIHKITYDKGFIEFVMNPNVRQDMPGHYALQYVRHFRYGSNDQAELIMEYEFIYGYRYHIVQFQSSPEHKRMFLERLKVKDFAQQSNSDMLSFEYEDGMPPKKNSSAIDYWGFYNGADNGLYVNENTWKSFGVMRDSYSDIDVPPILFKQFFPTADRTPNLAFAKAGSLKRVNTSQGASTEFLYELHDYSEYITIDGTDEVTGQSLDNNMHYDANTSSLYGGSWWEDDIIVDPNLQFSQWVKIRYTQNSGCNPAMILYNFYGSNTALELQNGEWYWIFLEQTDTHTFVPSYDIYDPCPATGAPPTIEIANRNYHDPSIAQSYRQNSGGLRIAEIKSVDNNGSSITNHYLYNDFDNELKSSGVLIHDPTRPFISGKIPNGDEPNYIFTRVASLNENNFNSANNVNYRNVEVYQTGATLSDGLEDSRDIIGRKLIYYDIKSSSEILERDFPFAPIQDNIMSKVLKVKEQLVTPSGGILHEKRFEYEKNHTSPYYTDLISGRIVNRYQYSHADGSNTHTQFNKCWKYSRKSETQHLTQITNIFDIDGFQYELKEKFGYFSEYSRKSGNLVWYRAKDLLNGDKLITKSKYSGQYTVNSSAIAVGSHTIALQNLLMQGRYQVPMEEITYLQKSGESWQRPLKHIIFLYRTLSSGKVILDRTVHKAILNPETEDHNFANLMHLPFNKKYLDVNIQPEDHEYYYSEFDDGYLPQTSWSDNEVATSILKSGIDDLIHAKIQNGELATSRYTSFENSFHGGWNPGVDHTNTTNGPEHAVTGEHYYNLADGAFNSFGYSNNQLPAGTYLLSYWSSGYVVTPFGGDHVEESHTTLTEGDWEYHEKIITWTSVDNWVTIDGSGFVDELRLHEIDASMSTLGYYPDGKLMYEADASSNLMTYEYDSKGRLEWVLDRERNVIEHHEYVEKDIDELDSFNKHFVKKARKENLSKAEVLSANQDSKDIILSISLTDGLGRHRQSIAYEPGSYNGKDIVKFSKYDEFGRQLKNFLPYFGEIETTDYIPTAEFDQAQYYLNRPDPKEITTAPYVETLVEASPLQRPLAKGGVGEQFEVGGVHDTEIEYGWNTVDDNIRKWYYSHGGSWTNSQGFYAENTLKKTLVTNPDGRRVATFTDARGREVAKTVYADGRIDADGRFFTGKISSGVNVYDYKLTSNTIYDDFGRVRYHLPAKALEELDILDIHAINSYDNSYGTASIFEELVSYYSYDEKGNLTWTYNPGEGYNFTVYNNLERLVMSGDWQQSNDDVWSFIKYDTRGRIILKGEVYSAISTEDAQVEASAHLMDNGDYIRGETFVGSAGALQGYTNICYPEFVDEGNLMNVYYFDNYDFVVPTEFAFEPFGDIAQCLEVTRGLATGSLTRVLKTNGHFGQWLETVTYYDTKKRPIQSYTRNHKGGWDRIDTYYNEFGQVEKTVQEHRYKATSSTHTILMEYLYWPNGMLRTTWSTIDNDPRVTVSYRHYDEQGKLKYMNLHRDGEANNALQCLNYRYNAQGKLTHINNTALIVDAFNDDDDDVFGQELTYFEDSDEYENPYTIFYDDPMLDFVVKKQYGGNVSSMMWNTKNPEDDGTMTNRNAYIYRYDDLGQMTNAFYAADEFCLGDFTSSLHDFDEEAAYSLNGNIKQLDRKNGMIRNQGEILDELSYTYYDNGFKLKGVSDIGKQDYDASLKHFIEPGPSPSNEYAYDLSGRMVSDLNRGISQSYNRLGRPRLIEHSSGYKIGYVYDAAGNKLQKRHMLPFCAFSVPPCKLITYPSNIDYIGNFMYEDGELKMIYHPEGVIRPTPTNAENTTAFVYDYFIKDYLGNVRVVITEENATYTSKFLATLEEVHAQIEEENFENLDNVREELPVGYPIDASVEFNEKIARLTAANGTEMGPSIVLPVRRGETVRLSTEYFYEEDAPGQSYDHLGLLVNEVLLALASSGAGVLPLNETQLSTVVTGGNGYASDIYNMLSTNMDTTDMTRPNAYLVWVMYDRNMNFVPSGSGAVRVSNPNQLELIIQDNIQPSTDGFLHAYVSNGGTALVHFDNFLISQVKGKVRQFNDYYPYGLSIAGINGVNGHYKNKYTSKELQTGEFPAGSGGLEMFDFEARFYDPQLGRWFAPDPAMQFANPYLAMGNNPVMYVDPDGEFIWVPIIIGAAIGAYSGHQIGKAKGAEGWQMAGYMFGGAVIGGLSGAAGYGVATSGMAFANTASIATGSFISSVGMNVLSGGETDVSIGLGVASYNATQNEWGYLGKKGNSTLENIGYGLGALANAADILAGFHPGDVELRTENDPNYSKSYDAQGNEIIQKDKIGHSQLTDGNGNTHVDWGPNEQMRGYMKSVEGTNNYERGLIPASKMKWDPITIEGVNTSRIANWKPSGGYNLCFNSCVTQTSRALNSSGVFNVGIHPYLLHAQMYLRSIGVRPYLFSPYLYQNR